MTSPNEPFLSMRDAVMEIRTEVKAIREDFNRIDREGSIGTKQELMDHETRLRGLERFRYSIPSISVLGFLLSAAGAAYIFFN